MLVIYFIFILKVIYFWLLWVSVAVLGLSQVVVSEGCSVVVGCGLLIALAYPVAKQGL